MNDNAKALVAALRSGRYKRGRGALHDLVTDEWCCLGVGCDLYDKAGNEIERLPDEDPPLGSKHDCERFNGKKGTLPREVKEWLGLSDRMGGFRPQKDGDSSSLTMLNDAGVRFAEIADLIESEPAGLFNGV